MSKFGRDKGKRGERKVIDWLQPIVNEIYEANGLEPVLLQRNSLQSDRGGSDLHGLEWLAAEVKNVETDQPNQINMWWAQCEEQAVKWAPKGKSLTPVLFYMRAHRPIRVRMKGFACCVSKPDAYVPCLVDISAEDFEAYFRNRLHLELS